MCGINKLDKAPRPSISNIIWILSSGTICQLNQIFSNSVAAMLSTTNYLGCKSSQRNILLLIICFLLFCHLFRHCLCFSLFHEMNELTVKIGSSQDSHFGPLPDTHGVKTHSLKFQNSSPFDLSQQSKNQMFCKKNQVKDLLGNVDLELPKWLFFDIKIDGKKNNISFRTMT